MNLGISCRRMKSSLVKYTRQADNGEQYIFRFNNNYGAIVARNSNTEGYHCTHAYLWELSVIKFTNDSDDSWEQLYTSPVIGGEAIGELYGHEVEMFLNKIEEL